LSFQVDVFCRGMHNVEWWVFLLNRGRFWMCWDKL
jgi:hypothetical protein